MTSGAGASYTYNAQGLRISKTVNKKKTSFTLINGKVWSDGTYNYVWGAELITNGSVYYLYNAHGDVVQLLNSSGTVTKTYDYEAYGNELTRDAADPNPFRYCGEYYDNETGFIYLRARYYNPSTGRFISQDPAKDGLNWYIYANDNPISYADPSVLSAEKGVKNDDPIWFDSPDEAAYYFGLKNIEESATEKKERLTMIYSQVFYYFDGDYYTILEIAKKHRLGEIESMREFLVDCRNNDGKIRRYRLGFIHKGDNASAPPIVDRGLGRIEAIVHTHGSYKPGYLNDDFSNDDMKVSVEYGVPMYLASNGGFLKKYVTNKEPIYTLADNLPYDKSHPDKRR